jgi:hypothetical protein
VLHYILLHSFVKKLKDRKDRSSRRCIGKGLNDGASFHRVLYVAPETLFTRQGGTVVDAEHTLFTVTARCCTARTPSGLRAGRIFDTPPLKGYTFANFR